jgi:hypothetical protein
MIAFSPTMSFLISTDRRRLGSKLLAPLAATFLCLTSTARADVLSFEDNGIHVDGGSMGTFTLEYPTLDAEKVVGKTVTGNTAEVTYDKGGKLTVQISGGDITYTFADVPGGVKEAKFNMLIPFSYQQGGKWKMDSGTDTPFPVEKPKLPHLFGDHATVFTLTNFEGKSLIFHTPDFSYQELQDNREWNWPIYDWVMHVPFNADNPVMTVSVTQGTLAPGTKPVALVDEFGELAAGDWPTKLHSLDDLHADVAADQAYYASLTPPTGDAFGGLPGSGKALGLQATGFFHVEKKGEKKWVLVDPAGNEFFHLGVCSLPPGDDGTLISVQRGAFAWLPSYDDPLYHAAFRAENNGSVFSFYKANIIRKYQKPFSAEENAGRLLDHARKWGFNSIGAFSPIMPSVVQAKNIPYVTSLPLSQWDGIKYIPGVVQTWDPYEPDNVAQVDKNFAKTLPASANDPLLIGYFLTNEPLYEDIPKVVPTLKGADHACKRELVTMLTDKYKTIDAFNTAWGTTAASFDALNEMALPVNTQQASEDMHDYTGRFFETYFKLVADTFHKHDTHHMLIGNRFQPGTINNEQLCRTAGKYLDVMSFNYYTDALDKDFLDRIYSWTGKPMFMSEFYWAANSEAGLAGGREVHTQQERGLAYRNYVEHAAALGYIVGIEWFTMLDEPSTGRWFEGIGGERSNSGLISVADRPYKPALAEMLKTNYHIYDVIAGKVAPYVFDNPRFTQVGAEEKTASAPHAAGPITVDGGTQNWPGIPPEIISGKRVVMGDDSGGVEGSFKMCWDENNLYVLVTVIDPTPFKNGFATQPNELWNGDGVEFFLGTEHLDQGGAMIFSDRHLIVGAPGAGKAPYDYYGAPQQYDTQTLIVAGGDGKSYTLEAAIPWKALGANFQPAAGTKLLFDIGIDDSTDAKMRQRQIMWNGTDKNSSDRTHWGRALLLK